MSDQVIHKAGEAGQLVGDDSLDPKVLRSIALVMTKDENLAIFRRFEEINLLNLLLLQDEIQKLSHDLKTKCLDKRGNSETTPGWHVATYSLGMNSETQEEEDDGTGKRRRELLQSLQRKLKEYNSALLELAQLRNLEPPDRSDISRLRGDLAAQSGQWSLPEDSRACWDAENDGDFAVLRSEVGKGNRLIGWVRFALDVIYWELWGNRNASTTPEDPNVITVGKRHRPISKMKMAKKSAFTSRLIMALFGGIALIVPTVIMAKNESINTSLITTSIATVLFAFILAFGATDSTGKDILAATAAYTAVLVVFVGTSLSGPGSTTDSAGHSNVTTNSTS